MDPGATSEVSHLLRQLRGGDKEAESDLYSAVYDELRAIAARQLSRERPEHTLQTTALVNEAYLRLRERNSGWRNREHFFAAAAKMMRQVLIDHARSRMAEKRGGQQRLVALNEGLVYSDDQCESMVELNVALQRLERRDRRTSWVVELHCFGGLSLNQIARLLGVSSRTVKREWNFGRAWLRSQLSGRDRNGRGAMESS